MIFLLIVLSVLLIYYYVPLYHYLYKTIINIIDPFYKYKDCFLYRNDNNVTLYVYINNSLIECCENLQKEYYDMTLDEYLNIKFYSKEYINCYFMNYTMFASIFRDYFLSDRDCRLRFIECEIDMDFFKKLH